MKPQETSAGEGMPYAVEQVMAAQQPELRREDGSYAGSYPTEIMDRLMHHHADAPVAMGQMALGGEVYEA